MSKHYFTPVFVLTAVGLILACQTSGFVQEQIQEHIYEGQTFRFTIPAGWATMQEVWGLTEHPVQEYYGLGVSEEVSIQYPPRQREGQAFFTIASGPLIVREDLETHLRQLYANAIPAVNDLTIQPFTLNSLTGYEATYKRPWGEPWWRFRDVWLEQEGTLYLLSFHASPWTFDNYAETFEQILMSFQFKP